MLNKSNKIVYKNQNKTSVKKNILKEIVNFIGLTIIPMYLVIILSSILIIVFKKINMENTFTSKLLITWFGLGSSFVAIPYLYLRKKYLLKRTEVGLNQISKTEFVIISFLLIILYIVLAIKAKISYLFIIATIQNLGVALSEEFYVKGILFYQARRIYNNSIFIVILSTLVFSFVLHNSNSIINNVIYRVPMGLITSIIYLKTKKIYMPVAIHFIYDMLFTSLF